jgi:cob(I)alamin adenosyltransferase
MKIYTRTGDQGGTGLFGGERVSKDDARVCTYGALDEANATLGVCAAAVDLPAEIRTQLHVLMSDLFDVGAELATPAPDEATLRARLGSLVDQARVTFILPTGTEAAARLHFARTVVRRAEREVVALARAHFVRPVVVMFLNRLSDALFVWARLANARARVPDAPWQKRT